MFIIDTDTAGDDNTALLMALRLGLDIKAITINCGNIDFDQQVENALYTVEFSGVDVPVYAGMEETMGKSYRHVEEVHGKDGMGNSFFPRAMKRAEKRHAVEAILDLINDNPGQVSIVELAPMTNLAMAIKLDRGIAKKVKQLYFMGGSLGLHGNITPVAEFNFWVDPDAAKIVLESGMPMTMVDWDITLKSATLDSRKLSTIEGVDTEWARFFLSVNRVVREYMKKTEGRDAVTCPDSLTVALALGLEAEKRRVHVDVEDSDGACRGASVVDPGREPNVNAVASVSGDAFFGMLLKALS
ncbi:MAG: nucleoside hydrolase [Nitrososphaerota archaeon]|jgi:purine nucleosidase|nr:nucleoside hydrolase [Nitrososphaerota archaeon]MDG6932382.1 nucleoside hydrolase [Nitrososphaerota archaeon]MDG6936850.1 nucleoside hydrolase [Nitrososphaerota archaeon]MDG6945011.1 nucleoside hydrolase [Nitrososphaerota archaeon]